jgi:hypothetical protein
VLYILVRRLICFEVVTLFLDAVHFSLSIDENFVLYQLLSGIVDSLSDTNVAIVER